jgi:dipeptidyl aminopeptidase/acylaminoacyl peptidase
MSPDPVVAAAPQQQLRQACAELEQRLRAGGPCTAEELFIAFPALAAHTESALATAGGVAAGALGAITIISVLFAFREADHAKRLEAALAAKTITLAREAWRGDDLDRACRLLEECHPAYRDRDWHYLHRVCHSCLLTLGTAETPGPVGVAAWSPDGRYLVSNAFGTFVRVWDTASGRERLTLKGHNVFVTNLAFDPEGHLVTAGRSAIFRDPKLPNGLEVKVWELAGGKELRGFLDIHPSNRSALSRGGRRLVCVSQDGLRLIDVATGRELHLLPDHLTSNKAVALSVDGRQLAWNELHFLHIRDTETCDIIATFPLNREVKWLAFGPDGRHLAAVIEETLTDSGFVIVWDVRTRREVLSLRGHSSRISSVAFSPDGRRLAAASNDRTAILWDLATGAEFLTLRGHRGPVTSVEFSPDGERLASTSHDGTVKIWDVRPLAEMPVPPPAD